MSPRFGQLRLRLLRVFVGQAVNVGGKHVDLVLAQVGLAGHVAVTTVTNGLLE